MTYFTSYPTDPRKVVFSFVISKSGLETIDPASLHKDISNELAWTDGLEQLTIRPGSNFDEDFLRIWEVEVVYHPEIFLMSAASLHVTILQIMNEFICDDEETKEVWERRKQTLHRMKEMDDELQKKD